MSRFETARRQYCDHCGHVTMHNVVTYLDHPTRQDEVAYCTECGK